MKQKKYNLANEEGSVLAFSVVMLTVMIFLVTIISLTTVNRIAVARRVSENSRETSEVENLNASLDKTIKGIVLQTDELTRYYLVQEYYQASDNTGFDSDVKPEFDASLRTLVDNGFQARIQQEYLGASGNVDTMNKIADMLFAHMLAHRTGSAPLPVGGGAYLYSFSSRTGELITNDPIYLNGTGDGSSKLEVKSDPAYGFRDPYDNLASKHSKRNETDISASSYLKITMDASYKLPESGNQITTDIEVLFTFPKYSYAGLDVSYPNDSETLYNNVIHYTTNVLTYQ